MSLTAPTQQRALDAYSDSRYSSSINRISRLITGGVDMILFQETSFTALRTAWNTLSIGGGIAVKDDVLIMTSESYVLDFDDNDYYVDTTGEMEEAGRYYVVMEYNYSRSLPAPKAYLKIIRDQDYFDNNLTCYVFLWAVYVGYNYTSKRYEISSSGTAIQDHDSTNINTIRPTPILTDCTSIDGGVVY